MSILPMKPLLLTTIAGVLLCQAVFAGGAAFEKIYLPPPPPFFLWEYANYETVGRWKAVNGPL